MTADGVHTVAERLTAIHHLVARVEGALRLLDLEELQRNVPKRHVIAAALSDVADIWGEAWWLQNLPTRILHTPAPTDDEAEEMQRQKKKGGA